MSEYLLLILLVSFLSQASQWVGIHAGWLVLPVVAGALPSIYAMLRGAPHVPSDVRSVQRMIELAEIQPGEKVADLGCGDGRILRAAMQKGAHATGYELSVFLYLLARIRGCPVRYQNFWTADLSQ